MAANRVCTPSANIQLLSHHNRNRHDYYYEFIHFFSLIFRSFMDDERFSNFPFGANDELARRTKRETKCEGQQTSTLSRRECPSERRRQHQQQQQQSRFSHRKEDRILFVFFVFSSLFISRPLCVVCVGNLLALEHICNTRAIRTLPPCTRVFNLFSIQKSFFF